MPVLVLDRDGVINQDSDAYIRSLADWRPIDGSIEAIARLSRAGYRVAIATNQSGIGRGYFTERDMAAIHARLRALVAEHGGEIAGIFHCPHLPDAGCACRKPGTGLLKAIAAELGESPAGGYFIGDSLKDLQAARAYGCIPVLVRTGKGEGTLASLRDPGVDLDAPDAVAVYADLAEAAEAILARRR